MAAELHRRRDNLLPPPELPSEIICFHILPWLPPKSILRFKSVSKQWHAFLTTPIFKNLHINKQDHHNPKLLLSTITKPCKFYTIDCEAPEDGLTACHDFPFETNTAKIHILTSIHGLVCIGIKEHGHDIYSDLFLWNPLTREYTILSKGNYHYECYKITIEGSFNLYYTSSDDDYKLLRVMHDNIYIYSLRSDSWRRVESNEDIGVIPNMKLERWWPSIWLNGKLYLLREIKLTARTPRLYFMLMFDTETESFTKITTPPYKNNCGNLLSFSLVRGHIHICMSYVDRKLNCATDVEVWRMDGDGEWTKVVSYSKIYLCFACFKMGQMHMMRNGKWMMHSKYKGYFCQIDRETNIKDISCTRTRGESKYEYVILIGKYVESFVSPNQYKQ